MSNYDKYTPAQRKAWGKKMAAARAAKGKAPQRKRATARAPVRRNNISGQGAYKMPRSLRPSTNTTKSVGGSIGAYLGHGIQNVIKSLTGFGDYQVDTNSIVSGTMGGDPPKVINGPNGFIIRHREYIADVYGSDIFRNQVYPINPGLLQTFPWLSQIADSFEQYNFRGLVFEFKSMSSDAVLSTSSSSALGTVIMSTQYNALDAPFVDKRTMENYEYANSTKPSLCLYHPIECKKSENTINELYVRTGARPGDLRLYDLGNFQIAVQGMQNAESDNSVIGELWATFEIEFYKPKLLPLGGYESLTDHYQITASTYAHPLSAATLVSTSTLGTSIGTGLYVDFIIFPKYITSGKFLMSFYVQGTSAAGSAGISFDQLTNISFDNTPLVGNTANTVLAPVAGSTTTQLMWQAIFTVVQTTPDAAAQFHLISINGSAMPTAPVKGDLIITLLPSDFS